MKKLIIAVMVLLSPLMGCAPKNTLYQQWGNKLSDMSGQKGGTKEDVSLLLGARPSRCETVQSQKPVIGIFFEKDEMTIKTVRPQSPADRAGLKPGDVVNKVDNKPITYGEGVWKIREGNPVQIETNRGVVTITPSIPDTEQCYWEINAGQISSSHSGAYFDRYGGLSNSGSEKYQRFFRASCRFQDGFCVGCQANWQG